MSVLAKLNPRERRLLIGGGALVAVLALWVYGWQPVAAERGAQQDRIARYLTLIDMAERAPDAAPETVRSCARTAPLAPRVTQSAQGAGIPLARLDPEGARLRVTVTETGYADAVGWIARLEAEDCVRAVAVDMTRLTAPGMISLALTLEEAGT